MRTSPRPWSQRRVRSLAVLAALSVTSATGLPRARGGEPDPKTRGRPRAVLRAKASGRSWPKAAIPAMATRSKKGGLRLDSQAAILKGGESGPAVIPGKPEQSLLVEAINYEGLEIPPIRQARAGEDRRPQPLGFSRRSLAG